MIDLYNLMCREQGAPADWAWFSIKAIGDMTDRANGAVLVEGCLPPPAYTKGPNKGQPNYAKRDKSSDRQFVLTMPAIDARRARYEAETGECSWCTDGKSVASVGRDGTTYRDCRKCNGTGKAVVA